VASKPWIGRLFFGTRRLLYAGPVLPTTAHAHHAHQVLLSPQTPVAVRSARGEPALGRAFFIPAHAPHTIVSAAEHCLLLFVDADDADGRTLATLGDPAARAADLGEAAAPLASRAWGAPRDWRAAEALADELVRVLVGERPPRGALHPAVRRAIRALPALVRGGEVRLASVAEGTGVSASRLAHLFSAEVGIPMRPYVLWLRLHLAAAAVAEGRSFTEAAHDAGFADQAHLSRVCRRVFGICPSQMALVEWVPPPRDPALRPADAMSKSGQAPAR
jgi:AraC-like DNA-binding protein